MSKERIQLRKTDSREMIASCETCAFSHWVYGCTHLCFVEGHENVTSTYVCDKWKSLIVDTDLGPQVFGILEADSPC